MARTRRIELEVDYDRSDAPGFYTDFDSYGAILYYAFTVNKDLALEMYKAMVSEYHYKLDTEQPLGDLKDDDIGSKVYALTKDLPQVINFIKEQILPSLELLPLELDLTTIWGIGDSFEAFLMRQGSFFNYFCIDNVEQDGYTVKYFIAVFNQLSEFFQEVVSQQVDYTVIID